MYYAKTNQTCIAVQPLKLAHQNKNGFKAKRTLTLTRRLANKKKHRTPLGQQSVLKKAQNFYSPISTATERPKQNRFVAAVCAGISLCILLCAVISQQHLVFPPNKDRQQQRNKRFSDFHRREPDSTANFAVHPKPTHLRTERKNVEQTSENHGRRAISAIFGRREDTDGEQCGVQRRVRLLVRYASKSNAQTHTHMHTSSLTQQLQPILFTPATGNPNRPVCQP